MVGSRYHAGASVIGAGWLRVSFDTNDKLGRCLSFGRVPRATCPVMTAGCARCFATRGNAGMSAKSGVYDANSRPLTREDRPALILAILQAIPYPMAGFVAGRRRIPMRIHAPGGDFDSPEYVRLWIEVARELPFVDFWFYTRAWMNPEIRAELERFRLSPNVVGFASVDWSIARRPEGWRIAYQGRPDGKDYGQLADDALLCPASAGREIRRRGGHKGYRKFTCADCSWCYSRVGKSAARGVNFPNH